MRSRKDVLTGSRSVGRMFAVLSAVPCAHAALAGLVGRPPVRAPHPRPRPRQALLHQDGVESPARQRHIPLLSRLPLFQVGNKHYNFIIAHCTAHSPA